MSALTSAKTNATSYFRLASPWRMALTGAGPQQNTPGPRKTEFNIFRNTKPTRSIRSIQSSETLFVIEKVLAWLCVVGPVLIHLWVCHSVHLRSFPVGWDPRLASRHSGPLSRDLVVSSIPPPTHGSSCMTQKSFPFSQSSAFSKVGEPVWLQGPSDCIGATRWFLWIISKAFSQVV